MTDGGVRAAKSALRAQLLEQRGRRSAADQHAAAVRIAGGLPPELTGARVVACYLSVGSEPGTGPLLEALAAIGVRTIVPVLTPDDDLDWATFTPGDPTVGG
ncbi:MAG: 5-formyltetrahydrofolate cyclo-ligase, partial [Actinomycetota bacterium]|nr:5-formyltetrahydrofolate cyclo-ligase [Actinomycetota bacterium]